MHTGYGSFVAQCSETMTNGKHFPKIERIVEELNIILKSSDKLNNEWNDLMVIKICYFFPLLHSYPIQNRRLIPISHRHIFQLTVWRCMKCTIYMSMYLESFNLEKRTFLKCQRVTRISIERSNKLRLHFLPFWYLFNWFSLSSFISSSSDANYYYYTYYVLAIEFSFFNLQHFFLHLFPTK